MTFYREAISSAQARVLGALCPFLSAEGFYLGGGTAAALHLGHRRSEDFDWFLPGPLDDPLLLAQPIRDAGVELETEGTESGTLHGLVEGVRVSFLQYSYPTLHAPVEWPEFECRVAALDDLACMKLAAIAQRALRKDFVDIYALIERHAPLADLLDLYRHRYQVRDHGHVVTALTYFDDAEPEPMPPMLWEVDWKDVKETIRQAVRALS